MDIYKDQIAKMVYEQKKLLEDYTREYRDLCENDGDGEDRLVCCINHDRKTYYRARRVNGRYVRKSLGRDTEAINALARKEFLKVTISKLKHNMDILESSYRKLDDLDFDSIRARMYKTCRELPDECFFTDGSGRRKMLPAGGRDGFRLHRDWADEPYEKSDYMPERRRFMTSGGFRVRSKSEQLIAEQLLSYGVPFRYEQVIHIDGLRYSSDFTFRDRYLEMFYWEHAGMMDDPDYVSGHRRKMRSFESIVIVPWKNLIITYDVDGAINIPMIKSIIENDVIPRL